MSWCRSKNRKPNPEILDYVASDDPGCGQEFEYKPCRARHITSKLRDRRGRRTEFDHCRHCEKIIAVLAAEKSSESGANQPEQLKKNEVLEGKTMENITTPEQPAVERKRCEKCGKKLTKNGYCHSCAAIVRQLGRKPRKPAAPNPVAQPVDLPGVGTCPPPAKCPDAASVNPRPFDGKSSDSGCEGYAKCKSCNHAALVDENGLCERCRREEIGPATRPEFQGVKHLACKCPRCGRPMLDNCLCPPCFLEEKQHRKAHECRHIIGLATNPEKSECRMHLDQAIVHDRSSFDMNKEFISFDFCPTCGKKLNLMPITIPCYRTTFREG